MSQSISVYSHDSDPAIDSPRFRISRHEAEQRLAAGYVRFISPTQVQLKPPLVQPDRTQVVISGLFDQAWLPRWSGEFIVWQMRSDQDPVT
jgi:hypothetical protein